MTKILHTSDLHGAYHELLVQLETIPDLNIWVDTGDFFPNKTRGTAVEAGYQQKWATNHTKIASRIAQICNVRNISVISVSGNHDYVSLASLLHLNGMNADSAHDLSSPKKSVTVHGHKFAGFREIPYIDGEWKGELNLAAFRDIVNEAMSHNPDILVTHAPPGGILDNSSYGGAWGVPYITSYLMNNSHMVKLHMFGHVHGDGGKQVSEGGIQFSNAASFYSGNIIEVNE